MKTKIITFVCLGLMLIQTETKIQFELNKFLNDNKMAGSIIILLLGNILYA